MIKIEEIGRGYIRVTSTTNKLIKNDRNEVHSEYIIMDGNREQYVELEVNINGR